VVGRDGDSSSGGAAKSGWLGAAPAASQDFLANSWPAGRWSSTQHSISTSTETVLAGMLGGKILAGCTGSGSREWSEEIAIFGCAGRKRNRLRLGVCEGELDAAVR
jgi:hypothetical protein